MIRTWLAALMAALIATAAAAQGSYPDKPVRFIVGFTAGSATDITARLFAQKFQQAWGVAVTVENVPGAGGSVGGDRVAKSAPDGTTFYWGANGALTINPTLLASQTYDVERDLAPVARLLVMPSILAVNNDVPAKSVAELIALAKSQPGKLSYASPGTGTPQHIAAEVFKAQLGLDIVHVPYRGSTGMRTDILSGQIQMLFDSVPTMAPMIKSGMVRALGTTGRERSPILANIPTITEAGVPGFQATLWVGFMAPAGTPQPVLDLLNREITKIVERPDIKAAWAQQGATAMTMSAPQFKVFMQDQVAKWAKVIADNHIRHIN